MNWMTFLVLAGVVLLGTVLAVILAWGMWREEQAKRAKPAPSETQVGRAPPDGAPAGVAPLAREAEVQPQPARDAAAPQMPEIGKAAGAPPGSREVLRVYRHEATGQLLVEVDGRQSTPGGALRDPVVAARLRQTLADLSAMVGPATGAAGAAPAANEALPLPTMNPFKEMQVLRQMAKQSPPPPPKPIAEQIDEVLQERVAGTGYGARGLHVRAGPGGLVALELDGQRYPELDAVPDAGARDLVRAAIAAWEASR